MDRIKYELEMDKQMRANKKQNYIQDSKIYFNEQFNRKKEIEDQRLTEKSAKINTSYNIKDEERRQEYKQKLLKMTENIEKNVDTFKEFTNNRDSYRNRYGSKSLYDKLRNEGNYLFIIFR